MANDPQEFVRVEEAFADKLAGDFEARTDGLAEQIALECTNGNFTEAYRLANTLDLNGMVGASPTVFTILAMQAVLWGMVEHHRDLEIANRVVEQTGIPGEAYRAIAQLGLMVELDIAEMVRDDILATIYQAESAAKDKLHNVSKRDLDRLYERWNEDRALDSDTPRLRDYIERRYDTMDRGSPYYLSAGRYTDRGPFPSFEGPATDGFVHAANLFAAMAVSVSPDSLSDRAFKHGNTRPWKDRFSHGPATLQTLGMEGPADPCCETVASVSTVFRNYGPESLQRHAFLYSKGGIGEPPKNSGEVEMGDKFSPSSLQFMFSAHEHGTFPRDVFLDRIQLRHNYSGVAEVNIIGKDDISEGELAANGGLLEPQQVQGRKKKKPLDLDDLEDHDGWSDRVLRAIKADSLYVHRPLLNTDELREWAKASGFDSTLNPDDLHVTVCYSKTPVIGVTPDLNPLTVAPGGREVRKFGKAIVLHFTSPDLANRNFEFQLRGMDSDFDSYRSHITISYDGAPDDTAHIVPFEGALQFGPEIHGPCTEGWAPDRAEAMLKADEELTLAQKLNQATLGTGKKLFDLAANLTTSRLIAFGFLSQASKAGQAAYQINAVLDDRTCPVCVYMHGKTFAVNSEYSKVLQTLGTSDPQGIKSLAPWPSQSKKGLHKLYSHSVPELQSMGYGSPPFHPRCRCYLTNAGTVTEHIPTGTLPEQVQAIIDGLEPENTQVVDDDLHSSAQELAEAAIGDVQAYLEDVGDEETAEAAHKHKHKHKHKPPKNQVSVDAVSPAVTDEEDLSELNAGEFTELVSHGDLDAQNAYLGALDTVPDGVDHDHIQALIDNGQFHEAVIALNGLGIDLNDFYLTPLGGSADLASHAHLTIEGTLDQNEIAASQLSAAHNEAVVAAMANLVGKIDYANAFTAYLNNDWATLDHIFAVNGINYSDYVVKKYDDDEPRDEQGRWTTDGQNAGVVDNRVIDAVNRAIDERTAGIKDAIMKTVHKLKFPEDRVVLSHDTRHFVVNGKDFTQGGSANV